MGRNTGKNAGKNENGATAEKSARDRLRAERERDAKRGRVRRQLTVAGAAVAVLALATGIGVALADSGGGSGSGAKDSAAARLPLTVPAAAAASTKDGTVITYGDKKAKETLTIYEDPRCPYCALFEQANGDTVKKLADQGRFKVEYRFAAFLDDALGGQGSKRALNALGAAADQGSGPFLALHQVLYANHPEEHDDAYASTGHLLDLAGTVDGLRTPAFDKAVKDLTYMPWVKKVAHAFDTSGVKGTPTVLLNGKKLPSSTSAPSRSLRRSSPLWWTRSSARGDSASTAARQVRTAVGERPATARRTLFTPSPRKLLARNLCRRDRHHCHQLTCFLREVARPPHGRQGRDRGGRADPAGGHRHRLGRRGPRLPPRRRLRRPAAGRHPAVDPCDPERRGRLPGLGQGAGHARWAGPSPPTRRSPTWSPMGGRSPDRRRATTPSRRTCAASRPRHRVLLPLHRLAAPTPPRGAPGPRRRRDAAVDRLRFGVVSCANWEAGCFSPYRQLAAPRRPGRGAAPGRLHLRVRRRRVRHGQRHGRSGRTSRPTRSSPSPTTGSGTRSTRPDPDLQALHAKSRSSPPGTTTSSPTTPRRAAPRTTSPTPRATGRPGRPRPSRRTTSGCRCGPPIRRGTSSTGGCGSAGWPSSACSTCAPTATQQASLRPSGRRGRPGPHHHRPRADGLAQGGSLTRRPRLEAGRQPGDDRAVRLPPLPRTCCGRRRSCSGCPRTGLPLNTDQWDGYTADRRELFGPSARTASATPSSSPATSTRRGRATCRTTPRTYPAVGLGRHGVRRHLGDSDNVDDILGAAADALPGGRGRDQGRQPHVKWLDFDRHGFGVLDVTPDRTQMDYYVVSDRTKRDATAKWARSYRTASGSQRVERADSPVR